MMPCFSRAFFQEALPTFDLSRSGTGFGLDYLWPHMLSYEDICAVDNFPVRHTRGRSVSCATSVSRRSPTPICNSFMDSHSGSETFGGVEQDGTLHRCDSEGFAARYRAGYAYLADRMWPLLSRG